MQQRGVCVSKFAVFSRETDLLSELLATRGLLKTGGSQCYGYALNLILLLANAHKSSWRCRNVTNRGLRMQIHRFAMGCLAAKPICYRTCVASSLLIQEGSDLSRKS